jgi:hypothetical protein
MIEKWSAESFDMGTLKTADADPASFEAMPGFMAKET